jgi:capsular polysaccharide biosynthesis protein
LDNVLLPSGISDSIKDWMDVTDRKYLNEVYYKEIYSETPVTSKIENRPPCPPYWYPNVFSGAYVAAIPKGRVWGVNGAIITPDNHLLWDVSYEGNHITKETHSIFKQEGLHSISYVKNAADLTHVYSWNYYHWMYEAIPRFHLLQRSGLTIDQFIVNMENKQAYQHETLQQLGIGKEQLLITHSHFHIEAENLIIPSQPVFPTKWASDFLRKTFLQDANGKSADKKRIFISRLWSRKITNEDQVMEVLSKYGFLKVGLEFLSVAEQVELFSSAEVVIGAHGAGLTNLTFCNPGTKVLELFAPTYIIPHYWAISSIADLEYHCLVGEENPAMLLNSSHIGDDITINIPEFEMALKKMNL